MQSQVQYSLFKHIDVFGKSPTLGFNGYDKFKTTCGAFATLVMFLVLIAYFGINSLQVLNGKVKSLNYIVSNSISQNKRLDQSKNLLESQVIGLALEGESINNRVLTYTFQIVDGKSQKILSNLDPYDCSDWVYRNMSSKISNQVPSKLKVQCFNISLSEIKKENLPVIKLIECSDPKNCLAPAERNDLLDSFNLWIFSLSDETDIIENKMDIVTRFNGIKATASNTFKKKISIYLKELMFDITEGAFIQNRQLLSTLVLERKSTEVLSVRKSNPGESFASVHIELDKTNKVIVTKEFQNLFTLFAMFGGLSKGITLLLFICVFPVREMMYYRKLMNETFNVCTDKEQLTSALEIMMDSEQLINEEEKAKPKRIDHILFRNIKKLKKIIKQNNKGKGFMEQILEEKEKKEKDMMDKLSKAIGDNTGGTGLGGLANLSKIKKATTIIHPPNGGVPEVVQIQGDRKHRSTLAVDLRDRIGPTGLLLPLSTNEIGFLNKIDTLNRITNIGVCKHLKPKWEELRQRFNTRDCIIEDMDDKNQIEQGRMLTPKAAPRMTPKSRQFNNLSSFRQNKEMPVLTFEKVDKSPKDAGVTDSTGQDANNSFNNNQRGLNRPHQGEGKGGRSNRRESKKSSRKRMLKLAAETERDLIGFEDQKKNTIDISTMDKINKVNEKRDKEERDREMKIKMLVEKNKSNIKKQEELKFYVSWIDSFKFLIPSSLYNYSKRNLYLKGKKMIQRKLDMDTMIKAFCELDKLKALLFDEDQLCIFERIPKPFLIDGNVATWNPSTAKLLNSGAAKKDSPPSSLSSSSDSDSNSSSSKVETQEKRSDRNIIITNKRFWEKDECLDSAIDKLNKAIYNIQTKESRGLSKNPIDKKLLEILNEFKSEDIVPMQEES